MLRVCLVVNQSLDLPSSQHVERGWISAAVPQAPLLQDECVAGRVHNRCVVRCDRGGERVND